MWSRRVARINELLLQEISRTVLAHQPPEMGFVTFTAVEITSDLMEAKVFYSVLGTEEERRRTGELLHGMKHLLFQHLRRLESLRRMPKLHFIYDETPSRAARVHELIETTRADNLEARPPRPQSTEPPPPPPRRRTRRVKADEE